MIQKIGRANYRIYALDVESHNDEESISHNETSIWLGCFIDETNKVEEERSYFYTIDEILNKLEEESCLKRHSKNDKRPINNLMIYIYNLSFEWSFILPVLLKRGFKWKPDIGKEDEYSYSTVSTKSVSSVWLATLKFKKRGGKVVFKDLSKIFGGGLGKVAKSFNLPTQKGEIDYTLNRLHNYVVTPEEKEYCFKDTRIIIDILLIMQKKGDKEFFNTSSMASYSMKKLIKSAYGKYYKPYQQFRKDYPELGAEETAALRAATEGGICYPTPRFQFKDINQKILHIDARQMHPSQMVLKRFPYGKGTLISGKPTKFYSYINLCHIKISYFGVKLHSIIKLIPFDFIDDFDMWCWDFEIPTMKKCYNNLKIEYIEHYEYKCKASPWKKYIISNYEKRLKAKAEHDDYNILYYKLLNNSAYGKFLEKPHNSYFQNYINELGIIDSIIIDKSPEDLSVNAKYTYLPYGSAVPAYSRVCLIETALLFGWEKIIYFDTDSIFCIYDEETWNVWETKIPKEDYLGNWGLEEISDRGQFTAAKRYKLELDGEAVIKAGGINFDEFKKDNAKAHNIILDNKEAIDNYSIPFDEINIISNKFQVKRAYRCKGGSLVVFQEKKIDVLDKYLDIYNNNC